MSGVKTMIKYMLGVGLLFIVGYVFFPEYHAQIAAVAPYLLLFLACPLAMYFMMKGMNTPQERDKKADQDEK